MAYAFHEKIARINLTTGTVTVEKLDTDLAKKFVGDSTGGQVNAGNLFMKRLPALT